MSDMEQYEVDCLRKEQDMGRLEDIQYFREEQSLKFGIRLIIAGGREFGDYELLEDSMKQFELVAASKLTIICGGARGADSMGEKYAKEHNLGIEYFIPEWYVNGVFVKSAGYKRNVLMGRSGTHLLAFWDGRSKGTGHMIDIAHREKLNVEVIEY